MRLMSDIKGRKSRVGVSIWDREGKVNKDGKRSLTFTVVDTTMDELQKFLMDAIREQTDG